MLLVHCKYHVVYLCLVFLTGFISNNIGIIRLLSFTWDVLNDANSIAYIADSGGLYPSDKETQ
jgi:hypothetical protein